MLQNNFSEAENKRLEATNNYHVARGQWIECENMKQIAEGLEHGADLVLMPAKPATT
jgi:hypothetical protein